MIGEMFKEIFRFKNLGTLDRSAIAVVGLSVVLVTLIIFLVRYCFNYGILKVFGMSLACGLLWSIIASAVITIFYDEGKLYCLIIGLLLAIWLIIVTVLIIKKRYFDGMVKSAIAAFIFIFIAILVCIPVKAFEQQIASFVNGILG